MVYKAGHWLSERITGHIGVFGRAKMQNSISTFRAKAGKNATEFTYYKTLIKSGLPSDTNINSYLTPQM